MQHDHKAKRFQELRERAERMLDFSPDRSSESTDDVKRLLQELNVMHIELEMQHDELLDTQRSLETSRNTYIRLFDHAPMGYVILDRMGLITDCNLAAAKMFGSRREYLLNKPFMTYVHTNFQQVFYKHRTTAFDSSQPQSCDLELVLRTAGRSVVKLQSQPLPAESGPPSQCLTAIMDITEQRELHESLDHVRRVLAEQVDQRTLDLYNANQELERSRKELESRVQERTAALEAANTELRESEARLRTLFMTSPDSITLSTLEQGRFVDVNEGFTLLSGYSRAEAMGASALDLGIWSSSEERSRFVSRLREEQSVHNMQTVFKRKDGNEVQCLVSARLLQLHGEDHVLIVSRDIRDLKRAEEKFRSIFNNSNLGIFRSTTSGEMLDVNPALVSMLGYDSTRDFFAQVQDIADDIYVNPEQRAKVIEALERSPEGVTVEQEFRRKDGWTITGRMHLRRVEDPAHDTPLLEGFVEDISERKRAEQALHRAQERYQRATAAGRTAVWQVDLRTGRVESEGIMERMLGLDHELHDIEAWMQLMHQDDRHWFMKEVEQSLAGEMDRFDMTPRFHHADGSLRWLSIQGTMTQDEEGAPLAATGTTRDVTDQKLLQRELLEAKERADAASEAKSGFLANMSHEIRTPLGSILGMTDLTLTTPLQEDQRKYVHLIKDSATSLLHIINDLLDISRIEAGKLDINPAPFELRRLLETTMAQFEDQALKKELALHLEVAPGVPQTICCDPQRLGQVLRNLLSNALKFTEKGKVLLRVEMLETAEPGLLFAVHDTGVGIAAEDTSKLFRSFSQLERSLSRKVPGSGLGLAISKELVEKMGGSIFLESHPGEGSVFSFTLPFQNIECAGLEPVREPAAATAPPPPPLRVVLAEDNPVNAEFVRHFLKRAGHEVLHATTGAQALELWRSEQPDLVLMDIQMQDMDGMEATRALRQEEQRQGRKRTPVIALTAYAMDADKQRFLAAGMDDCVTKPVDMDTLLAAMAEQAFKAGTLPASSEEPAATVHEVDVTHFDDEQAKKMVKGSMEIVELLRQKFLYEAAPELMGRLRTALQQEDAASLGAAAHSLKGSSATICAIRAHEIIVALEQAAREEDMDTAAKLVDDLAAELAQLERLVPRT